MPLTGPPPIHSLAPTSLDCPVPSGSVHPRPSEPAQSGALPSFIPKLLQGIDGWLELSEAVGSMMAVDPKPWGVILSSGRTPIPSPTPRNSIAFPPAITVFAATCPVSVAGQVLNFSFEHKWRSFHALRGMPRWPLFRAWVPHVPRVAPATQLSDQFSSAWGLRALQPKQSVKHRLQCTLRGGTPPVSFVCVQSDSPVVSLL